MVNRDFTTRSVILETRDRLEIGLQMQLTQVTQRPRICRDVYSCVACVALLALDGNWTSAVYIASLLLQVLRIFCRTSSIRCNGRASTCRSPSTVHSSAPCAKSKNGCRRPGSVLHARQTFRFLPLQSHIPANSLKTLSVCLLLLSICYFSILFHPDYSMI